jgi:hypothetical protein
MRVSRECIASVFFVVAIGCSAGGGSSGSGGPVGGAGGTGNTGGTTSTSDIKITGSATQCPGTTPMLPQGQIASCASMTCQAAHCVPADQVPKGTDTTQLGKCPDGTLCTPDDFIATFGQFLVKSCTSIDGAEGRCISTCIPRVAEQMTRLPQTGCAPSERCAPCYDPIDGADTHACSQGCDTGPKQPKYQFAQCGGGRGLCVPKSLVPPELQAAVPVDTCTQPDHVCAPTEKVKDINFNFPACAPSNPLAAAAMPGPNGQKGGCVPAYLVTDATKKALLAQDTCQERVSSAHRAPIRWR